MKIRHIDADAPLSREHVRFGIPPVEESIAHPAAMPAIGIATWTAGWVLTILIAYVGWRLYLMGGSADGFVALERALSGETFWTTVLVGFLAQVIDGALGMAYGVTATTFLLAGGTSPAMASASVHIAEIFTTGISGMAHARLGNVDRRLFLRLLLPGVTGAVLGAWVITTVDGDALKPWVTGYLVLMGVHILFKAVRRRARSRPRLRHVGKLALFGGFVDAAGGGGWGPVVTSTLLGSGNDPRTTIGSVNFAEFFLTLATGASFLFLVGAGPWPVVAGLILGGWFAAPLAAVLCRHLPARTLLLLVGILVTGLGLFNLLDAIAV